MDFFPKNLINDHLLHFPEVKKKRCSDDKSHINDAIKSGKTVKHVDFNHDVTPETTANSLIIKSATPVWTLRV